MSHHLREPLNHHKTIFCGQALFSPPKDLDMHREALLNPEEIDLEDSDKEDV